MPPIVFKFKAVMLSIKTMFDLISSRSSEYKEAWASSLTELTIKN